MSTPDQDYTRQIVMNRASDIPDDVPTWAWTYGDRGRIALSTVSLWAGRPGAGKSTSARWFVAQVTRGTLAGCWLGQPTNVAYVAREESISYVVKPSLRAHGADLARVFFPEVEIRFDDGVRQTPVATADMDLLIEACRTNGVRLVVVDPLMSMIGGKADVNRNNEVRSHLEPWRQLAEKIDGVVVGIAHLNKSGNGDVVAGINGSSAFGEIARSVFGFAKDPDAENGERVMSQEKNSLGDESLALSYRIESTEIRTDSGRVAEVGRFVILGDSDKSVGDVLRDAGRPVEASDGPERTAASDWLSAYLGYQIRDSADAKRDGKAAGFSERTLQRARQDLGVAIDFDGRKSTWRLPSTHATGSPHVARGTGGTGQRVIETPGQSIGSDSKRPVPPVPRSTREHTGGTSQTPPGGITASTPGVTSRVQQILNRQEAE
ncbi:AAA domain-containing protein [Gordonia malaquae]|uniref:AAA+ ATPase domain-containing protein n=1 Tax=Gordonia malaquae NBRC 108250 TaxID=1223542 RepID=M3UMM2_GORML|nr:AAA family ATPase [Gordonia malaquae]GAC81160.1 hypothetical protein GM1_029_00630 [Gordonia malaquae NBRC 108250]SEC02261.1 AAA domain-containing protein [Gordonia malaquae]